MLGMVTTLRLLIKTSVEKTIGMFTSRGTLLWAPAYTPSRTGQGGGAGSRWADNETGRGVHAATREISVRSGGQPLPAPGSNQPGSGRGRLLRASSTHTPRYNPTHTYQTHMCLCSPKEPHTHVYAAKYTQTQKHTYVYIYRERHRDRQTF